MSKWDMCLSLIFVSCIVTTNAFDEFTQFPRGNSLELGWTQPSASNFKKGNMDLDETDEVPKLVYNEISSSGSTSQAGLLVDAVDTATPNCYPSDLHEASARPAIAPHIMDHDFGSSTGPWHHRQISKNVFQQEPPEKKLRTGYNHHLPVDSPNKINHRWNRNFSKRPFSDSVGPSLGLVHDDIDFEELDAYLNRNKLHTSASKSSLQSQQLVSNPQFFSSDANQFQVTSSKINHLDFYIGEQEDSFRTGSLDQHGRTQFPNLDYPSKQNSQANYSPTPIYLPSIRNDQISQKIRIIQPLNYPMKQNHESKRRGNDETRNNDIYSGSPANNPSPMIRDESKNKSNLIHSSLFMLPRHENQQIPGEHMNNISLKSQELPKINYAEKAEKNGTQLPSSKELNLKIYQKKLTKKDIQECKTLPTEIGALLSIISPIGTQKTQEDLVEKTCKLLRIKKASTINSDRFLMQKVQEFIENINVWLLYWHNTTGNNFQKYDTNQVPLCNLKSIFPVFLFYVEMILTVVPDGATKDPEIHIDYFSEEMRKAGEFLKKFAHYVMISDGSEESGNNWKEKKNSILNNIYGKGKKYTVILWYALELWIQNHHPYLWKGVSGVESKTLSRNFKIFFDNVFFHGVHDLTLLLRRRINAPILVVG